MPRHSIRLLYILELLVALMVILFSWGDLAGTAQLDLIPWYVRLALALALALAIVRGTACAVENEKGWNPRAFRWLLVALGITAGLVWITYTYHLQEPVEEDPSAVEDTATT
jgi:hypothetical protein